MFTQLKLYIYVSAGLLGALLIFLVWQVLRLKKRLNVFLKRGDQDLEKILGNLVKNLEKEEKNIKELQKRADKLEQIAEISFQKSGVIRYSPFKGVGGDQSFSLALLDKNNTGLIITSLYLKERNRAYMKPIEKGKSEYSLSEEEEMALKQAKEG